MYTTKETQWEIVLNVIPSTSIQRLYGSLVKDIFFALNVITNLRQGDNMHKEEYIIRNDEGIIVLKGNYDNKSEEVKDLLDFILNIGYKITFRKRR